MSGLYFRGKLTYAQGVRRQGPGTGASSSRHTRLAAARHVVRAALLEEFAGTDRRGRPALPRAAGARPGRLRSASPTARVVLLGSIASEKYVDVLARALGSRLHYPPTSSAAAT